MLDPLTLDQLRTLIAIAETGSFSAASRKLQRVQSAVSQTIHSLEQALGIALFDRSGKIPKLNEAGSSLLVDARRLLAQADILKAHAQSMVQGVEPELTLAVDPLFPNQCMLESLAAFDEAFPTVPVTLLTEALGAPEHHLRDGTVRMAIYCLAATGATDLDAEFLMDVPMVPVVAATHALAQIEKPLTVADFERHTQLVLKGTFLDNNRTYGIVSPRTWRFADFYTRLSFMLAGFGWGNMPEHLVADHLAAGALKRLETKDKIGFTLAVHLVHERKHPPGVAGTWLVDALKRSVAAFAARQKPTPRSTGKDR